MKYSVLVALTLLSACASQPKDLKPVGLVRSVDLERFMGDWYVIAAIPTVFEKDAYNPKDSYRLEGDGTIATTFSFNVDSPDGPLRTYSSRGFVLDRPTNAVWGQQYVWPFKADYRISYLSPDYTRTVVARDKRDYVWILARTPTIPESEVERLTEVVGRLGYDVSKLQRARQAGLSKSP